VKRSRGRGRRPQNSNNNSHHHNHNRAFDSTGPDVKIRGTASHVYEKYLQLARDAGSAGDRVMQENYLQHAEHYYRILMAQGAQMAQQQPYAAQGQPNGNAVVNGNGNSNGEVRPVQGNGNGEGYQAQPPQPVMAGGSGPSFSFADADEGDDGDDAG
jgi:Domain of unknown function (DUF4167)